MKIIKKAANEREIFEFLKQEIVFNTLDGFHSQNRKEIGFYFIDR